MNNKLILSSIVLVIANISILFGVILFDWNAFSILFVYWTESVIIGFFSIFKIKRAQGKIKEKVIIRGRDIKDMDDKSIISNFIVSFGVFHLGYLIFLITFSGLFKNSISFQNILFFTAVIFLSHLFSYRINFVGNEEFKKVSKAKAFYQPYQRLIVMHIIIIFMGMIVAYSNKIYLAVLIVIIKTPIDLIFHLAEHLNWFGKYKGVVLKIK